MIPPPIGGDRDLVDRPPTPPANTPCCWPISAADSRRSRRTPSGSVVRPCSSSRPATTPASSPTDRSCRLRLRGSARGLPRATSSKPGSCEESDPTAAIAAYRGLIARQPGFAEAHYRLAILLDRAGDEEAAYRQFIAARDCDGYPIRCLVAFQDVYREVAARHGVILINGQAELHAIGPPRTAGRPSLPGRDASLAPRSDRAGPGDPPLASRRHAFGWPNRPRQPIHRPARSARTASAWARRRGRSSACGASTSAPTRGGCATIRRRARAEEGSMRRPTTAWSPARPSSRGAAQHGAPRTRADGRRSPIFRLTSRSNPP